MQGRSTICDRSHMQCYSGIAQGRLEARGCRGTCKVVATEDVYNRLDIIVIDVLMSITYKVVIDGCSP